MAILGRLIDIVKSNVNDLIDRAEDPEKIAKLELEKRIDMLAECKNDTAEVMAAEKRAERDLCEAEEGSAKFAEIAKQALMASKNAANDAARAECERDAERAIAEKQKYDAKLGGLRDALESARASSERMKELTQKLTDDIESLRARVAAIESSVKMANAQESVNKADKYATAGLDDKLERMERKAASRLDKAAAAAELASTASSADSLAKKYGASGSQSVSDELSRMKSELGL